MYAKRTSRHPWYLVVLVVGMLALSACSAGSLGSSDDDDGGGAAVEEEGEATESGESAEGTEGAEAEGPAEPVAISLLTGNQDNTVAQAEAVIEAFQAEYPIITVELETRPGGSEGDNLIKTRLATDQMNDIFVYNTGSLFQALNPTESLTPVTGSPWIEDLDEVFTQTVTAEGDVYGSPFGTLMGGGVLYNSRVYEELGLEVPLTWDEVMANNAVIDEAGLTPVIQTYQDTWTSQLFVLGDFHNVAAVDPDWAEKYTANEVKYVDQPALRGFEHQQEIFEAGYMNEDFASATTDDGVRMLAEGEGVHYPILTFLLSLLAQNHPDAVEDIGFFALPGHDAETNGLTSGTSAGTYIPQTTQGAELEAAKLLQAFLASPAGCEAQTEAITPEGPYHVLSCTLPADVPPAVSDLASYFEESGRATPALEFSSPIKGPALEQITVEVGSGIRSAADGAALYDEDVEKQAQQLGLEGW